MCRISLEPDSCVRRIEDVFIRYGVRSLIVAKFVPGLSTVAPPLAGMSGVRLPRFIAYSVAAGFLWAATWGGLGYLTGEAVQRVTDESARVGRILAALVAAGLVIYIGGKWIQRRRFLRNLRVARISQDDVKRALDAGESIVIVDFRSPLDVATVPFMIPGSLRIAPDDLERRHQNIPRDRDIVLYCSCPSEATSARVALTLRRRGVTRVRPLEGGFPAWHARGLPVEAVPAAPRP